MKSITLTLTEREIDVVLDAMERDSQSISPPQDEEEVELEGWYEDFIQKLTAARQILTTSTKKGLVR